MREIEYRIWDTKKKKMFYSYDNYLKLEGELWSLWEKDNKGKLILLTNSNDGILLQFIELKDKNGKKIYEGDILQLRSDGVWVLKDEKDGRSVVEWDEELCGFSPFTEKNDEYYCGECEIENFKVIGNVWENKELLKND